MRNGKDGFVFRVWAPHPEDISVVGSFNRWNPAALPMEKISEDIWEAWSDQPVPGDTYKYLLRRPDGSLVYKLDPVGFMSTRSPETNSIVCSQDRYTWHDNLWLARCARRDPRSVPINIYELHLGSWMRKEDGGVFSYEELAPKLAEYVCSLGYTHVEVMPLAGHPYDPSWGYQVTNFYSPTSRYGSPDQLRKFVDTLHQAGIGVILDFVAGSFPKDESGLFEFDGTCTYESSDPVMNEFPQWGTRAFDLGKPEVRSFLISCAVYWLEQFHFDGLRVDAVSSMLYLSYGRPDYRPNCFGGDHNLEAISFLRELNAACLRVRRGIFTSAEESTPFPLVTASAADGGLGFTFKWNMGWMNDTLLYVSTDPIFRKYHHSALTFPMSYACSEQYILPLSHDEVVHGKRSLIGRMPGDYFWKFAGLRVLRGYQTVFPGKMLSFMGNEFAQFIEWDFRQGLDWCLLEFEMHQKMLSYTRSLNKFYLDQPALWESDCQEAGCRWIQPDDRDNSIISFRRISSKGRELICILNFTPVERRSYRLGLPRSGTYRCLFSSDEECFGGTGIIPDPVTAEAVPFRDLPRSGLFLIPPMSLTVYARVTGRRSASSGKNIPAQHEL